MKIVLYIFLLLVAVASVTVSCDCKSRSFTALDIDIINSEPDSLLRILTIDSQTDNAILRKKSADMKRSTLKSGALKRLIERMICTVSDPAVDGVGIAAPQVGINKRLVVVQRFDKEGEPFEAYPNIHITEYSQEQQCGNEGCLSVPNRREKVTRSQRIVIRYIDPTSLEEREESVEGFTAVIFQHEVDHLEGVVYIDRL